MRITSKHQFLTNPKQCAGVTCRNTVHCVQPRPIKPRRLHHHSFLSAQIHISVRLVYLCLPLSVAVCCALLYWNPHSHGLSLVSCASRVGAMDAEHDGEQCANYTQRLAPKWSLLHCIRVGCQGGSLINQIGQSSFRGMSSVNITCTSTCSEKEIM